MAADDTLTLTIESEDASDELEIPAGLVDLLAQGDQSAPEVVGDIALSGFAQQAHGMVHHAEEEPDEALVAAEEVTMDLFEERFGVTFGEATGHSH